MHCTYAPIIFDDIEVLAALIIHSLPSSSTLMHRCSWMYLQASLQASLYPVMIEVGWILYETSSSACFSSSAAIITCVIHITDASEHNAQCKLTPYNGTFIEFFWMAGNINSVLELVRCTSMQHASAVKHTFSVTEYQQQNWHCVCLSSLAVYATH